jgi:hypothetical protein
LNDTTNECPLLVELTILLNKHYIGIIRAGIAIKQRDNHALMLY